MEKELDMEENLKPPQKEFPMLPELTMLNAKIIDIDYRLTVMNGEQQFLKKMTGEVILDMDGNKIPKKEFNITFALKDHCLDDGSPRKCWLALGASFSDKSNLPKVLAYLKIELLEFTPQAVLSALNGKDCKFQVAEHITKTGKKIQKVLLHTIRP